MTEIAEENAQLEAELRQIMAEVMQPYNAHINALIKQVDYLTGLVGILSDSHEDWDEVDNYKKNWEVKNGTKSSV